jgi:hypothetical protein
MADTRKVTVEVTDNGTLKQVAGEARKLNDVLDRTAQPRKVQTRAASAALSASGGIGGGAIPPTTEGLGRGTAGAQGRGDARDFGRQAQGLGGLVHLYATFAANVYAVSAAFNALSKAADFTNMEKAADILSRKVGASINGLAKDMKDLTDGAISMADALGSASLASSAGLTTTQIKELTTVAKGASIALGRDMTDALQRVFRGTIKIEPELLDELGLMVKVDDANKAYAKTLGKTVSVLTDYERRQAFVNAVTTQGINKYKELADQAANPFSKLFSTIKDLSTGVLTTMNSVLGPFVNMLSQSPTALLLGMIAIVGLLLKQAIPAIGNMREAWIASSKAAQDAVESQIAAIEAKQKALIDAKNEEKRLSQVALKETQSNLEKGLKKTLSGKQFDSLNTNINSLLWGKPEDINKNRDLALASVDSALKDIDKKIKQKQAELARIGKSGDKELKKLETQRTALQSLQGDNGLIQQTSTSAGQAASANATTHAHEKALQSLKIEGQALEHVANKRKALSAVYEKTELLGFRNGFADLNKEIAKLNLSPFEAGMLRLRGGLGALTISVGRLLGTFSVWGATAAILLPILGGITNALGLTTDHAAKLEESMTSLNSKLDLSKKISEDLKVAGDFHTIFELNASSAMSFAESLGAVSEAMKKYNDFKANAGLLTSYFDDMANMFTLGYGGSGGKIAMDPIMEEFDRRMATDKKFAAANKDTFTTNIKGASTPAAASFRRANALGLGDTEDVVRKVFSALNDPKLRKEAKEYADTASGMSKNLKELNDISSDYIISITNQSKELKALNAFSTSSAQAIKLLDKNDLTKSGANIQEFLSGITDQFEEMSGISLPADLELLRTRLNRLQEDVNNNYKTAMELAGSDKDLQKKAEDDRAKSLSQGTSSLLGSYGGIEKVQQDYIGYSLKASKSLADLATAAGRASLAQTSLSAKLKETQFYGSFSKEGEARAIREARKTEEKIANIQIKAEKTNAAAIDAQKSNTEQQLRTALSLASKELFKNSKSNNPSPLGTGSVKDQAIQALSVKELDGSIASQILSLVNSLESLGAASVIATLKIDSIRASLGKARESEARAEFKETDAEADKKFKPEEDKLFEELNNLEKKSQSIALLDSSYLSARVDSEINLIKAKADILQYEKDLAIKIGEYNTLVEQLIKDPTNVSIGEAVVGKARARDEAFKKGEPLRDLPKVIQDEENLRIRKTNLEITEKLSDNLSEQVDLASSYSDYLLSVSTNYSKIAEFNTVSTQTLLEQYSIQERILEAQIAIEKSKVGDREAEQKIVDLQQQHLAFKLDTHQKLTDLFKKETELSLKIREQSGRASDIFGTEGLQEAITIAMDRIEETTGKSKSVMSQLATGIVDSADIIVDSFTTMIQKMDETKLTFKAFSDMVRNTLSDMFRDMASDAFKNAMKSGIKLLAANFGYDTRTNQEKAASALQITANSSLDQLKLIQQDMRALLQALVPGKIDPIAQQGIDLDKQYNLDWEKANKANDTGVRTSPYPYPTSASIMSRQLDGVSSIGATSASAGTYDPLVQAVSSTASSAKETNRLLNEIAQKINPSSIPVPDVIQPPAMQDSSTPILSKTATTNIEKGGTKIDVAADKFNMATTVMHGAVGALVGALATGGSAKGALGGILMGVATSVISGGITGGLTSIFAKAKGGIVGPLGDMPLHKYARGGIATSPQMALFGEGSKNEAYVPLPDNRSIPVTLKGGSGGATFGDTNITVTVTNSGSVDTSISADQATNLSKALSVSIKATIQEELMKQMKPRGMLHG